MIPNFIAEYKGKGYNWRGMEEGHFNFQNDTINHQINATFLVPYLRTKHDQIRVQIWNKDGVEIQITALDAKLYEILGKK
ncbi:MAG: hypothetical protein M9897_11785 [Brumimicrobium sp.]|nr:hypothetical protein [Brumimicrobium sp.]